MQDADLHETRHESPYLLINRAGRRAPMPVFPARNLWEPFAVPALPYREDSLAPVISAEAVALHYQEHYAKHVQNLNEQLRGSPYQYMQLEQILHNTRDEPAVSDLFSHAAQVWNHWFFWNSLRPGGGRPGGALAERIDADFGGFEDLRKELLRAALARFGSGWIWLVQEGGRLWVIKTIEADTPIVHGMRPLLTIDVWEHAYYLDYRHRRAEYTSALIDRLLNWKFAQKNFVA